MRVHWEPAGRRVGLAEGYAVLGWLVAAGAWLWPVLFPGGGPACPLYARTGVPCAACGFTRAFTRSAHLDLPGAVAASPLGTAVFLAMVLFGVLVFARWAAAAPWPRVALDGRDRLALGVGTAGLVLGNWAWILWRHFGVGDWG